MTGSSVLLTHKRFVQQQDYSRTNQPSSPFESKVYTNTNPNLRVNLTGASDSQTSLTKSSSKIVALNPISFVKINKKSESDSQNVKKLNQRKSHLQLNRQNLQNNFRVPKSNNWKFQNILTYSQKNNQNFKKSLFNLQNRNSLKIENPKNKNSLKTENPKNKNSLKISIRNTDGLKKGMNYYGLFNDKHKTSHKVSDKKDKKKLNIQVTSTYTTVHNPPTKNNKLSRLKSRSLSSKIKAFVSPKKLEPT